MTFSPLSPIDMEVLVALAWAAPLTSQHLRQLAAPELDQSWFHQRLLRLERGGLVAGALWYRTGANRKGQRVGRVWAITPKGVTTIPEERRPERPAVVRQSLLDHDLVVGDLVAAIARHGRSAIGGLTLAREVRLDREQPRPKCDAILVIRSGPPLDVVPWVPSMAGGAGEALRGWAVEVDRRTEGAAVIREKAVAYQRIWNDPAFYTRYGRMPIPLWIVPDTHRADLIMQAWHQVWPGGTWYVTTDAHVPALRCVVWNAGQQHAVGLLDGWGV